MLGTWAACCIFFGVSISLVTVKQGWLTFSSGQPPRITAEDEKAAAKREEITQALLESDAAKECIANPEQWKRLPFFWHQNQNTRKSAFIIGTLHKDEKLAVEPLVFVSRDRKQFVFVMHIGKDLCGHDGIVHGGILATLFDEATARPAFWNLPRSVALTASLKINYRRPVVANQVLVLRTEIANINDRKAEITAHIENAKGTILCDSEVLYISPKDESLVPDFTPVKAKLEAVYPGEF
ncbi:hypothetical protein GGF46_002689 [Coemansia sp. RSA 552]|nr:hypothetical protein GGF46_002689 [Coemansia sp. RSA 552]